MKLDKCMFAHTDFVPPEDWGPEYPIPTTIRHNVPFPTLYSGEGTFIFQILISHKIFSLYIGQFIFTMVW